MFDLLLADFLQSLAFLIYIQCIHANKIESGTPACFLQGLLVQVGDPGSGLFLPAIVLHALLLVVWGYRQQRLPYWVAANWKF